VDDRILLRGIRVRARHGVSEEERSREQEFEIDLECSTDADAAARTDELAATIDYARLRAVAIAAITGGSYRLLETVAERIAHAILAELRPRWVRVRVTKLMPEGVGTPASVEILRGEVVARRSAPIELHVPDLTQAKRFYTGLGFRVAREEPDEPNGYLVMAHGDDVLRFWTAGRDEHRHGHFASYPASSVVGYGVEIVLTFDDLDAAFDRARELGRVIEPIRLRRWGLRDFRVLDPYGFYLRCTEAHDPLTGRSVRSPAVPSR
jgi:7,8-dihydroneopterin aldolase/epimerase/oxygenase